MKRIIFESWTKKYARYVSVLAGIAVVAASFFIIPAEAALNVMTMHEIYSYI